MADSGGLAVPARKPRGARYIPPAKIEYATLNEILDLIGRPRLEPNQLELLTRASVASGGRVYWAGDLAVIKSPSVAVVGARAVTQQGAARAERLSRGLAQAGISVVSGLAAGVDTVAHTTALRVGGRTAAVIGTPLEKAYPADNAALQQRLYETQLLLSPFANGATIFKSNFPARNRVMAALTDGTAIVEASDTSGTLHQAAECQKLGRFLFLGRSLVENPELEWPKRFVGKPKVVVFETLEEIVSAVAR